MAGTENVLTAGWNVNYRKVKHLVQHCQRAGL
jgi:hypothetical protein